MVILDNNYIFISADDESFFPIRMMLTFHNDEKKLYISGRTITQPASINYAFTIKDGNMYVPIGLLNFIKPYIKDYIDNRQVSYVDEINKIIFNINEYAGILDGITLRPEQLLACRKALYNRRCLIQCNTGFGKSEVACATIKLIKEATGSYPTTLMIEPTLRLVQEIYDRFEKYHIPVTKYPENRKIIENKVNICHPKSLNTDMMKDNTLLDNVIVLISDECHHHRSKTYRDPVSRMHNLEYSIGLSASGISQEHVGLTDIKDYGFNEVLVMSATGPLVLNIKAEQMIDAGNLADPILLVLSNLANEYLSEKYVTTWTKIAETKLESVERNNKIVDATKFFIDHDRKVLILVSTIRWSRKLLKIFKDKGIDNVVASYGSGRFETFNGYDYEQETSDVMSKFNNNIYQVMIGTSHIYEGADFKTLDVLVMAASGKSERIQIQCAGRVLRKSKNGKYAYIVDFTDSTDVVLSKHSRNRLARYKEIIGIPEDRIYYDITIEDLQSIFEKHEM